jgi:hypothetical protein
MKYRCRIYNSTKQRAEIWDRWQRGESMSLIVRRFDWTVIVCPDPGLERR